MDQVLDRALDRLPHTLLQLRVGLEQRNLQGIRKGERIKYTGIPSTLDTCIL